MVRDEVVTGQRSGSAASGPRTAGLAPKKDAGFGARLEVFDKKRSKTFPGYSTEHMTPDEEQAASETAIRYDRQTQDLYRKRFAVPTVAAVNEFKAKGIDVSEVEEKA